MKQIARNYKSGELAVLDAPAPVCRPGGVLVQSLFSLISTSTEMMKLVEATAAVRLVGVAHGGPLPSSDDLAVARHLRPGRLRAGTATLKFYEARDTLVDIAGIACKPITLGSRLIS
jgi:hypothetical protein